MENNSPFHYNTSRFLPSRRIQLVILTLIIVAVAILVVPKIVSLVQHRHPASSQGASLIVGSTSQDPTIRDSSGTGIPDWEMIAVGLNPLTATAQDFKAAEQKLGSQGISQLENNETDTDKLSLVLYNDLTANSEQQGETTDGDVVNITQSELVSYISAAEAKNKAYTAGDLTVTTNETGQIESFYTAVTATNQSIIDSDFTTHLTSYLQGTEAKSVYFTQKIASINAMVAQLLKIPVPSTAVPMDLAAINALSGIAQTIDAYDPTNTDSLTQFGTLGVIQDYIHDGVQANADLSLYFSLLLDASPTAKK